MRLAGGSAASLGSHASGCISRTISIQRCVVNTGRRGHTFELGRMYPNKQNKKEGIKREKIDRGRRRRQLRRIESFRQEEVQIQAKRKRIHRQKISCFSHTDKESKFAQRPLPPKPTRENDERLTTPSFLSSSSCAFQSFHKNYCNLCRYSIHIIQCTPVYPIDVCMRRHTRKTAVRSWFTESVSLPRKQADTHHSPHEASNHSIPFYATATAAAAAAAGDRTL